MSHTCVIKKIIQAYINLAFFTMSRFHRWATDEWMCASGACTNQCSRLLSRRLKMLLQTRLPLFSPFLPSLNWTSSYLRFQCIVLLIEAWYNSAWRNHKFGVDVALRNMLPSASFFNRLLHERAVTVLDRFRIRMSLSATKYIVYIYSSYSFPIFKFFIFLEY